MTYSTSLSFVGENRDLERQRHSGPRGAGSVNGCNVTARNVVCLQELKATTGPDPRRMQAAGLSRVLAHPERLLGRVVARPQRPLRRRSGLQPSAVRPWESRIVQVEHGDLVIASVYVPNGGKDYAAKLAFVTSLRDWAARLTAGGRQLILCGDMNIARSEMDVHPKDGSERGGTAPAERALPSNTLGTQLVIWDGGSIPTIRICLRGGRMRESSRPEHRWRLDMPWLPADRRTGDQLRRGRAERGNERSRTGNDGCSEQGRPARKAS